jgi:hypothetical protein
MLLHQGVYGYAGKKAKQHVMKTFVHICFAVMQLRRLPGTAHHLIVRVPAAYEPVNNSAVLCNLVYPVNSQLMINARISA